MLTRFSIAEKFPVLTNNCPVHSKAAGPSFPRISLYFPLAGNWRRRLVIGALRRQPVSAVSLANYPDRPVSCCAPHSARFHESIWYRLWPTRQNRARIVSRTLKRLRELHMQVLKAARKSRSTDHDQIGCRFLIRAEQIAAAAGWRNDRVGDAKAEGGASSTTSPLSMSGSRSANSQESRPRCVPRRGFQYTQPASRCADNIARFENRCR